MANLRLEPDGIRPVWQPCTSLEELQDQTRLLYEFIIDKARQERAAARKSKKLMRVAALKKTRRC
jgi:hypothetical protein